MMQQSEGGASLGLMNSCWKPMMMHELIMWVGCEGTAAKLNINEMKPIDMNHYEG
jgi:hypothetical protein